MNKKVSSVAVFTALISLAFYGAGCNPFQSAQEKAENKAAEKMTEKLLESMGGEGIDVDIDEDGSIVNIKDNEGGGEMMFGEEIDLPSDLDEGIIIYSDAKPISVIRDMGDDKGAMITLTTQDEMNDIADWYEEKYEDAGWNKAQSMSVAGAEMRAFENGNEQVLITIGANDEEDGGNVISINWSVE